MYIIKNDKEWHNVDKIISAALKQKEKILSL